ncbi:MAG: hypothetical protein WDM71_03505 [Ferruginibacter sp.]
MNKQAVSWMEEDTSDGLHQAIEAKENVKIEASTQTYALLHYRIISACIISWPV